MSQSCGDNAGGGVWVKDGRGRHTNIAALLALTRPLVSTVTYLLTHPTVGEYSYIPAHSPDRW